MKKALFLVCLVPSLVLATSLIPHSIQDRVRSSTRVVLAQVTGQRVVMDGADPRSMRTITDVIVGANYRGQGPERLQITQLGGTHGLWNVSIPLDAKFRLGEQAILFLKCRTADQCVLVSMGEGKLALEGDQAWVHDMFTDKWARRSIADVVSEIKRAESAR